jgi:hypothetical protein
VWCVVCVLACRAIGAAHDHTQRALVLAARHTTPPAPNGTHHTTAQQVRAPPRTLFAGFSRSAGVRLVLRLSLRSKASLVGARMVQAVPGFSASATPA